MKGPLFYSKILLFGEYGIIKDSKGLSIPYNFYKGALKYSQTRNDISADSNSILQEYYKYLKTLDNDLVRFNLDQMALDISHGMYFDSSIPRGYGVGSSGALVAAVYDRYALDKITVLDDDIFSIIINLSQQNEIGTHFIAVYVLENKIIYFDSFGNQVNDSSLKRYLKNMGFSL